MMVRAAEAKSVGWVYDRRFWITTRGLACRAAGAAGGHRTVAAASRLVAAMDVIPFSRRHRRAIDAGPRSGLRGPGADDVRRRIHVYRFE